MSAKNFKFVYYRSVLHADPERNVDLSTYFDKINKHYDQKAFDKINSLAGYQIGKIEKHDNFELSNGIFLPFPIWELYLIHKRVDVPGKINEKTQETSHVELNDTERIIDEVTCLYDPTHSIFIHQSSRPGISTNKIAQIINHFVDSENNLINLSLCIDEHILDKALNNSSYTLLNVRMINTHNIPSSSTNDSVHKLINATDIVGIPTEYSASVELNIKTNPKEKKSKFDNTKMKHLIPSLLAIPDFVDKLIVKTSKKETDKPTTLNLLKAVIYDKGSFELNKQNRYISQIAIFNNMAILYNKRRVDLSKK